MRHVLLRRLKTLEMKHAEDARPRKAMLPAWLLETLVAQGAKLTERGELDLNWLAAQSKAGARS